MNEKKWEGRLKELEQRIAHIEGGKGQGARLAPAKACHDGPQRAFCEMLETPEREFDADVSPHRLGLIRRNSKKWVNGTRLRFYFFERSTSGSWLPDSWSGDPEQKQAVRDAFDEWKALGIGLEFEEVTDPAQAEVKIRFQPGGSASFVGRDAIDFGSGASEWTMNFGWDLTTPYGRDTALHEIGHALGFPHEHQNPLAGIVWDEAAVLASFSGPPNEWDEAKIRHNILDKLPLDDVSGSNWDPDSIMHYHFGKGLISQPAKYKHEALIPAAGLSSQDIEQARLFYPELGSKLPELRRFEVQHLELGPGQQADFAVRPSVTRWYDFRTFGDADTVMVLFEDEGGALTYRTGDDDSGTSTNAAFEYKLIAGREYVLRVRLYWAASYGETAVMSW